MMKNSKFLLGSGKPLGLILGPCVIESRESALEIAHFLKENIPYPFVFKASADKANRSSIQSFRGPGFEKGLAILEEIKHTLQIPVTTDIHESYQANLVKGIIDIIQIPAFLCRQTDLLIKAAETKLAVNVKKGQFLAPEDMRHVLQKLQDSGATEIFFTERGTSFGYHNLVVDFRSIGIMQKMAPVIFDATHSLQKPSLLENSSGGDITYIDPLARAAIAAGCDGIFLETHMNPNKALSDAKTQVPAKAVINLVKSLYNLHTYVQKESTCLQTCTES